MEVDTTTKQDCPKDAYPEQIKDLVDSFGCKWELHNGYIWLNTAQKKEQKLIYDRVISSLVNHLFKHKDPKVRLSRERNLRNGITPAKIGLMQEILADFFMISVFAGILWEFTFSIFNPVGLFLTSAAIILTSGSLIYSVRQFHCPYDQYLTTKFGFKRDGVYLKTNVLNISKKKENELVRNLFISSIFILLALLPLIYKNPALIFVNNYLNFILFFLVIFIFFIQYLENKFLGGGQNSARIKLVAAFLSIVFFVAYTFSLLNSQIEIKDFMTYIIDIIVMCGIFLFVRDTVKVRAYHSCVKKTMENIAKSDDAEP